jgi:sugar phosphate isomerase/epimerase
MSSRRSFLRHTTFAAAGAAILPNALKALPMAKDELTGIQLYSVRTDMKKDPMGTLKAVSNMGYKHVEHADYVNRKFYGWDAKDFKKVLSDLGMDMPSGHTVFNPRVHWDNAKKDFSDSWKYTVEDAATCGQEYVISPSINEGVRKSYDDLMLAMDQFNKCGELCRKSGMKYGYHNHDFEFLESHNGKKIFDIMLENTDPKQVFIQLDIGNMYHAGGRAPEIFRKYPGRFLSLHVKDEIKGEKGGEMGSYESTILGKGVVGVAEVLREARKSAGTRHYIIEQESYQGRTPLDCIQEDLTIMKKWGY